MMPHKDWENDPYAPEDEFISEESNQSQQKKLPGTTSKQNDMAKSYFDSVYQYRLLTPEETKQLFYRMKQDPSVRTDLINHNLRLVISIAKKFSGRNVDLMDLIQYGNEGLIWAVDHYDVTRDITFSTYAYPWILKRIREGVRDDDLLRKPDYLYRASRKIENKRKEIWIATGREAELSELAEALGCSVDTIKGYIENDFYAASLYGTEPLPEMEHAGSTDITMDTVLDNDFRDRISQALLILTEQERDAIIHYYGLDGQGSMTLEEIALLNNVSGERIRQRKKSGLEKLRNRRSKLLIEDYY